MIHLELIILEGTQTGRHISLERAPVTFGRSSAAGLPFPLDSYMSGMHLTVQHALSCVILIDLNSSNGTFLNGERIKRAIAIPGDTVKIGNLTMKLAVGKTSLPEIDLPQPAEPTVATILLPAAGAEAIQPEVEFTDAATGPISQPDHPVLELLRKSDKQVFCLVNCPADARIAELLALNSEQKASLHGGSPDAAAEESGPYIVQVGRYSLLLQTLVDEGWGKGWASYLISDASFGEVCQHFSRFYEVQIEAGEVYFRFYDPAVLRAFLDAGSPEELRTFFAPVSEWVLETAAADEMLRVHISGGSITAETTKTLAARSAMTS